LDQLENRTALTKAIYRRPIAPRTVRVEQHEQPPLFFRTQLAQRRARPRRARRLRHRTPTSSRAAIIVDQDHLVSNNNIHHFSSGKIVQSFRQANGNIAGGRARYENLSGSTAASVDFTVELFDALPGNGGNLLTSGTVSTAGVAVNVEFELDFLWVAAAVIPEIELFLRFSATDGDYGPIGINAGDSYARGHYFLNNSMLSKAPDPAFQTYTDTGFSAVPAPGMAAILGLGLIGLGFARR
jgi:hypothetical protein